MNSAAPLIRIEMIQRSLKCFWLGLFSLVPILGIPLFVMALGHNHRVKQIAGGTWNPAHRYQYWGVVFARMAVVLLCLEATSVIACFTMLNYWPTFD